MEKVIKEPCDIQPECWFWGSLPLSTSLCLSLFLSLSLWACRTAKCKDDQLNDQRPLQGFWRSSRLVVAKPGAKGAEKHIFLIDSPGVVTHDGCPGRALSHFHLLPRRGKLPFFLSLFTFDYPDGQEARRPAPRITALSALAIPSLETFDAGTCARAAD